MSAGINDPREWVTLLPFLPIVLKWLYVQCPTYYRRINDPREWVTLLLLRLQDFLLITGTAVTIVIDPAREFWHQA